MSNAVLLSAYRRDGDRAARERVIEQNLPLVHAIARRFSRRPDQVDDLVQVGAIGLIKAVDGFAEERGGDLGAYAVPTIVGELRRSVGERSWPVRRPRGMEAAWATPVVVPLDDAVFGDAAAGAELERTEERLLLHAGIRSLSRRERRVIVLRYYRDWSQQRIALELGLSQPQVSRTLATALRKLREELGAPDGKHCAPRHT
jgi:RNA polymerase sigma-B factor